MDSDGNDDDGAGIALRGGVAGAGAGENAHVATPHDTQNEHHATTKQNASQTSDLSRNADIGATTTSRSRPSPPPRPSLLLPPASALPAYPAPKHSGHNATRHMVYFEPTSIQDPWEGLQGKGRVRTEEEEEKKEKKKKKG
ncbi:MAG: hypothetical protein LQ340_006472 [Diploschistes diacapsis]|nr:MAG: hypothetical protein LQ340_006472 [Diploschistes diacapsis]